MDTQNPTLPLDEDSRPQDQQQQRAAAAHPNPNPNDPAVDANSPGYGEFGGVTSPPLAASYAAQPTNSDAAPAGRSGANDNPDEFSAFRNREQEARQAARTPADQPGHVEQNQDPAAVRAARNADSDEQRAAWAQDDPRYAGGGSHNTREESSRTEDGE
ncbi:MAG: hypothetical protein NVS3B25_11470 [Hymenobacter sp.]